MISQEPIIKVGVVQRASELSGTLNGKFTVANVIGLTGDFSVRSERGTVIFTKSDGQRILSEDEIACLPLEHGSFLLKNVPIGIGFHWEQSEDQTFEGRLRCVAQDSHTITAVNEINLESYLKSVISSEMSAEAPMEFLRAHAIVSRSWLLALLERNSGKNTERPAMETPANGEDEIIRWYGHEDHDRFDVCADDHCQRYQGVSKITNQSASGAIESTRGVVLTSDGLVCDARYSKACGGLTENYENVWEDRRVQYLQSVCDSPRKHKPLRGEHDAVRWIDSRPEAYCDTTDQDILRRILPSTDQETKDFYRWKVEYRRDELEEIIKTKSGIDFGSLQDLVPVSRGPSGRIIKLKIVGTARTVVVGKELEIRKWLSKAHLYSSAFIVKKEADAQGNPVKFILNGAGWGHGVGLCQIGAAVMGSSGIPAEEILRHYFKGSQITKLY
jgi:stage II sporulation protein D